MPTCSFESRGGGTEGLFWECGQQTWDRTGLSKVEKVARTKSCMTEGVPKPPLGANRWEMLI